MFSVISDDSRAVAWVNRYLPCVQRFPFCRDHDGLCPSPAAHCAGSVLGRLPVSE